ncbi:Rrf2 family transcriptional regulator [Bdellovibrio sp. qaytius]|nr:Rrf2 family transcriptional regulator [Bdellovibrio sp. qaytius]
MLDQKFAASVHIMTLLAAHTDELQTSEVLAGYIRTNPTVVRRLLAKMVEAKLIDSFKGKSGGVRLAKTPNKITLEDIYKAVSDKNLLNCRDVDAPKACKVSCSMKKIFEGVSEGLEATSMAYLSKIKLSDVLAKV